MTKTCPRGSKKKNPYQPKLVPETATLDQIIQLFGSSAKEPNKSIDPNLFKRYVNRAKEVIVGLIKDKGVLAFVQSLNKDFVERPNKCQMTIWHAISQDLCTAIRQLRSEKKNLGGFFIIRDLLKQVENHQLQQLFAEPITNDSVSSKNKR